MAMTSGKADPQKLFFAGKLKIGGNVMASQKLMLPQEGRHEGRRGRHRPTAQRHQRAARPAPPRGQAQPADLKGPRDRRKRLAKAPSSPPSSARRCSAHQGPRRQRLGPRRRKAAITTLARPTMRGRRCSPSPTTTCSRSPRARLTRSALFQRGQLRVDGDVRLAHHLSAPQGLAL
jgi:3-hydroxyacyl-CoA dehydrogenase/3a,7a,12a-trihydroxy-5b-cholest-24-enoyl-CoA hydratase